jgi:hypothetical protein
MPSIRVEMNYLKTYINLIRSREKRGWDKKTATEYVERHHIFPQKIYGKHGSGNKRCVYLTAREHYICHALLEKICIQRYGVFHWKTISMTNAHIAMKGKSKYYNSYLYEQAKKRKSDNMKGERHHLYNIGHSDYSKEKISKNHYLNNGGIHPLLGRNHSEESKLKMSEVQKGKKKSKEFCENQSKRVSGVNNPFYGKKHDENIKKKMSELKKGKKLSDEHKKNISKAISGDKNPFFGKSHNEESKLKISLKNKNRVVTDKQKEAVGNAAKGTIFINNGIISKRIPKHLEIPNGWVRGRVKFKINRGIKQ